MTYCETCGTLLYTDPRGLSRCPHCDDKLCWEPEEEREQEQEEGDYMEPVVL